MSVLYVSFGFKLRPRTFGCVAMSNAVLFMLRSRFLLYSAGSGVNRVHVILSGFSVRLLKKYITIRCGYGAASFTRKQSDPVLYW